MQGAHTHTQTHRNTTLYGEEGLAWKEESGDHMALKPG